MLSLQEFKNVIQIIKGNSSRVSSIVDATDWHELYNLINDDTLLYLLEKIMDDHDGWIGYWIYEQNFGEDWDDHTAREADGTPIILKTPEQLYHYLVREKINKTERKIVFNIPSKDIEGLNDFEVTYCPESGKYSFSLETIYQFDNPEKYNSKDYLLDIYRKFREWMIESGYNTKKNISLSTLFSENGVANEFKSIESLFSAFKVFTRGIWESEIEENNF